MGIHAFDQPDLGIFVLVGIAQSGIGFTLEAEELQDAGCKATPRTGKIETHLEGPREVEAAVVVGHLIRTGTRALPVGSELHFRFEHGFFAQCRGEDLIKARAQLWGGERARGIKDAVQELVQEDIDGMEGVVGELCGADVGEDDVC